LTSGAARLYGHAVADAAAETTGPVAQRAAKVARLQAALDAVTAELPIPRGRAGPGMLADTIVRRWQDHQPLHRLERISARDGLTLNRSTLCGWHEQLAELATPLVDVMLADALRQPVRCPDATGVLVQAPARCRTGHVWVLVAPARHVLFRYSRRHDGAAVDAVLPGYQGYLVADAHSVYDHLFADGRVTGVGCWSHAPPVLLQDARVGARGCA